VRVAGRVRPCWRAAQGFGVAAAAATLALSAPAAAQTGGATPTPTPGPAPAPAPAAPLPAPSAPPVLTSLACVRDCAGTVPRARSLLRLRGRRFDAVDTIAFLGGPDPADDVVVPPVKLRTKSLDVRVPHSAASGPVVAVTVDAVRSAPLSATLVLPAAPAVPAGAPSIDVEVMGQRLFYGAQRTAQLTYVLHGGSPAQVLVEVVRTADGVPIARWSAPAVAPETPQTVAWDGTAGGRVQREGRYYFRVSAQDQAGARAQTAQLAPGPVAADSPGAFVLLRNIFPVRGPHRFGTGTAAFGGGRGHQGQDTFAACGTPLVAARGGTVQFAGFQARAGNYLVIDADGTGVDYVYMHLRDAPLVEKDDRVYTSQLIGYVGDTGDAQGCHLHFELWTAPGWYEGGSAFDPLPSLTAWDRHS
jgi:murein DD-endopeptidase MepM/ murein hydrolase activator NlpD